MVSSGACAWPHRQRLHAPTRRRPPNRPPSPLPRARSRLVKSTVVDSVSGKSVDSRVRTSSGTFLARGEDEVVRRIEKRIALVTMIPEGALLGWAVLLGGCAGLFCQAASTG